MAIETRLDPAVREAVFTELGRIGCKNVEIKCDAADQLVFFIAVSSLMKLKSSSKADEEGSASV